MEAWLGQWVSEAPVLAGSAVVVLVMIGVAALLGFRTAAKLDDSQIQRLAEAEGAALEGAVVASDGRSGLAQLAGGKLMVARVMGNDVSARVAAASSARVRLDGKSLSVTFGDLGFPPLHMQLEDGPPAWLSALAAGEPA